MGYNCVGGSYDRSIKLPFSAARRNINKLEGPSAGKAGKVGT